MKEGDLLQKKYYCNGSLQLSSQLNQTARWTNCDVA